ncbi:MAG: ABC transporter ATP-binding protein [Geminicoccaceae bacterium]|nr:ABC transporter ATP-binding protein [Geminicoccaceae bacterium]
MASSDNPLVEIDKVSKRFGSTLVVDRASLSLHRGEFLTIVGPSGCGKTTLLRMIAGFELPSEGTIRIHGADVMDVPPYRRSIGMVFQRLALFPHMTAGQNVAYPLKMRRFRPEDIPGRVRRYLALVKLEGYENRRPHELSGGQQQRVAIARALSYDPDLLLLDEPLSALDRKLREEMQLEFRRIQRELGVTTINVTHDQREALVMSDKIIVMNDGVVQQTAAPVDLYRMPENRFVAGFVGMTSILRGEAIAVSGNSVEIRIADTTLRGRSNGEPVVPGAPVDCAIRAEQVHILTGEEPSFENGVDGRILQRIFEGDRILYTIEVEGLGGAVLNVFDHDPIGHAEYRECETVRLGWKERDLFAFPVD